MDASTFKTDLLLEALVILEAFFEGVNSTLGLAENDDLLLNLVFVCELEEQLLQFLVLLVVGV